VSAVRKFWCLEVDDRCAVKPWFLGTGCNVELGECPEMIGFLIERFTRGTVNTIIGGWIREDLSICTGDVQKTTIKPRLRPCFRHDVSAAQDNKSVGNVRT